MYISKQLDYSGAVTFESFNVVCGFSGLIVPFILHCELKAFNFHLAVQFQEH